MSGLARGVSIGAGVTIHAFTHLTDTRIGDGCHVGPFARMRGNARMEEGGHVGNFVELKNVEFGKGAKASHLSYLGDAIVGAKANIGAGTITCNYDGVNKHVTQIGAGRLHRLQFGAGRTGFHRRGRLCRLRQRHRRGRPGRCHGRGPRPAGDQARLRQDDPRARAGGEGCEVGQALIAPLTIVCQGAGNLVLIAVVP